MGSLLSEPNNCPSPEPSLARELARELALCQARLDAIVRNTPGLVCQLLRLPDGSITFPYLSDACLALLGVTPEQLQRQPDLFLALILPEHRPAFQRAMNSSASTLSLWDWEGRIRIDAWRDVKWIKLRATPHRQDDGVLRWEGIISNITERRLEQQAARDSRQRLAELTAHINTLKEQERTRIAREVHDELGGNLSAIKMALAMLARHLPDNPALADKTAYIDALVDRTIEAIQRIALDLRPALLDLGIVAALEWQVNEFDKQMGVACSFHASAPEIVLDPDTATALFRIFQEALTNVAKHAQATRVTVRLRRTPTRLVLSIADNGVGITARDRRKNESFGMRGMHERARALGGTLSVADAPDGGTVVTIKIGLTPCPAR